MQTGPFSFSVRFCRAPPVAKPEQWSTSVIARPAPARDPGSPVPTEREWILDQFEDNTGLKANAPTLLKPVASSGRNGRPQATDCGRWQQLTEAVRPAAVVETRLARTEYYLPGLSPEHKALLPLEVSTGHLPWKYLACAKCR